MSSLLTPRQDKVISNTQLSYNRKTAKQKCTHVYSEPVIFRWVVFTANLGFTQPTGEGLDTAVRKARKAKQRDEGTR